MYFEDRTNKKSPWYNPNSWLLGRGDKPFIKYAAVAEEARWSREDTKMTPCMWDNTKISEEEFMKWWNELPPFKFTPNLRNIYIPLKPGVELWHQVLKDDYRHHFEEGFYKVVITHIYSDVVFYKFVDEPDFGEFFFVDGSLSADRLFFPTEVDTTNLEGYNRAEMEVWDLGGRVIVK